MDYNITNNQITSRAGIPYDDISWYDVTGQPFGVASQFNAIVFGNANNLVDANGAMAVGGNFVSPRGLSLGFGGDLESAEVGYSPDMVRFLVGNNVSMNGPLGVVGHVVTGGDFRADKGSTYLIGKSGMPGQMQELERLYHSDSGSPYWTPSDKGNHYIIPSYDVARFIPARRVDANVSGFFQSARSSIDNYKNCIEGLEVNGEVIDNFHEWILRGNNPRQNVFLINEPNGLLRKGIRAEVPEGSLVIVRIKTGDNAHLQYGLMGEQHKADHTLYVFEDAKNIFMEVPAAIWGSFLAPQATLHAHSTGGHITGNAALNSFAVNPNSGFEFHLPSFVGGVICEMGETPLPTGPTTPESTSPEALVCPEPPPCPVCPESVPCPVCPTCPEPMPCPTCPEPISCPVCPEPMPCPACPEPMPCPVCPICPEPMPCPACPEPPPCPVCPICPEPTPCPPCPVCPVCPEPMPCPVCPVCPEPMPCPPCPEPMPCPPCPVCPPCPKCMISEGIIAGRIKGCSCRMDHEWELRLYQMCGKTQILLFCKFINCSDRFEFQVPYNGSYLLKVCPTTNFRRGCNCKPIIELNNIGVSNFIVK